MEERKVAVYLTIDEIRLLQHGLDLWYAEPYENFPSPRTHAGNALEDAATRLFNKEDKD
jgi:hypothetical protein